MSTVFETKPQGAQNLADICSKLEFQKQLQAVSNKIHATSNVDEIMLELGQDICSLLGADRLTVYAVSEDRNSIVSKVKTGLTSLRDLKLPINDQSVPGFVALNRTLINIRDVYDDNELRAHSPQLRFSKEVDKLTGYRTKQMLVSPVVDSTSNELIGVVQAINTRSGQPFSPLAEEGVVDLCETFAIAFKQRQKPQPAVRGKYDALVANAVLSAEEMELALRSARRKGLDIENVLLDEFQVKPHAIGEALSAFFGVPYEAFKADRVRPMDLPKHLKRDFLERSVWVPVEDTSEGLIVVTTDPERVRASRIVSNVFPKSRVSYRVTTGREFVSTLDQLFGMKIDEPMKPVASLLKLDRSFCATAGWIPVDVTHQGLVVTVIDPEHARESKSVSERFPNINIVYEHSTQARFNAILDKVFGTIASTPMSAAAEWTVPVLPRLTKNVNRIFLSYSRRDEHRVMPIAKELLAAGINLWIDQLDIQKGANWDRAIRASLASCVGLTVMLSPNSSISDTVLGEIEAVRKRVKPILPVLIQECELPYVVSMLQFVDLREPTESGMRNLVEHLLGIQKAG